MNKKQRTTVIIALSIFFVDLMVFTPVHYKGEKSRKLIYFVKPHSSGTYVNGKDLSKDPFWSAYFKNNEPEKYFPFPSAYKNERESKTEHWRIDYNIDFLRIVLDFLGISVLAFVFLLIFSQEALHKK